MTLREITAITGIDANPIGSLMACFRVVRTVLQREAATFDGTCASLQAWLDIYGEATPENVLDWLDSLGPLADYDFADATVAKAVSVEDTGKEESKAMLIYVSGATATLRRIGEAQRIGHLLTPANWNDPAALMTTGRGIAVDNAAFSNFDHAAFLALAEQLKDLDCFYNWLAVPDIVGDARATLGLFAEYAGLLLDADPDRWPLAFVGQDGAENLDLDDALGLARCLFIGGSTEWKLSAAAADLAAEAKRRGLWLHMGRVNTKGRLRYAREIGCDSVDGSGCSKWPDANIPTMIRWLRQLEAQPSLWAAA